MTVGTLHEKLDSAAAKDPQIAKTMADKEAQAAITHLKLVFMDQEASQGFRPNGNVIAIPAPNDASLDQITRQNVVQLDSSGAANVTASDVEIAWGHASLILYEQPFGSRHTMLLHRIYCFLANGTVYFVHFTLPKSRVDLVPLTVQIVNTVRLAA